MPAEAEAWEPCTLSFTFLASASLSVSQVKNLVLPWRWESWPHGLQVLFKAAPC